ncbi:Two-component system response regulator DccR [hydrothermal vent metagenome]|uniref:Two-component system response regulator DccR n=1 Tax=hydrothermal vent metagenome TaxID=652676 RepID=A0A1W1C4U4_9ZZZZ
MKNILLLEDDMQLNDTIKQFLEYKNYKIYPAYDAHEAKDILYEENINLMLLDIKVPYQNGFDFLAEVRAEKNSTPAIFITSLNGIDDVTKGFDIGCDDYIRKPFALKELLLRVDVIFKRELANYDELLELGNDYIFNMKNNLLMYKNKVVNIRSKELKLLIVFIKNRDKLLEYNELYNELWDYSETPSQGSLRAYITTVRNILGKENIQTIKNTGYRYVNG